jgi:putative ABC transport system substrate-binding protein
MVTEPGRRARLASAVPAFALLASFGLGFVAIPSGAAAQQPRRMYRVALVFNASPVSEIAEPSHPIARAFVQELRALGYAEGHNLVLERRSAEGIPERHPTIMAELVRLPVDVIVTAGDLLTRAAQQATSAIPIVMVSVTDPVARGYVASLARPGGNITGVTDATDYRIEGKRLELLKEAAPGISRVAVVHQTPRLAPAFAKAYKEVQAAAQALGVTLLPTVVERPEQLADTLAAISRERADGLLDGDTAWNFAHRHRLVELAAKARLPAMYAFRESVEAGGLMSYGTSLADLFRRAADYVDKILKGARPADLPVEQPTKFDLLINLKTARALGLSIPQNLLLRADEVIQ